MTSHAFIYSIWKRKIFLSILMTSFICVHFSQLVDELWDIDIHLITPLNIVMPRYQFAHFKVRCHATTPMVKLQIIKFIVAYAWKEGSKRHYFGCDTKYPKRCRLLLWSSDSEHSSHVLQFQTECGPHRTKLGHSSTMIQSIKSFTCAYACSSDTVQVLESIEAWWIHPILVKLGMRLGTMKCQVLQFGGQLVRRMMGLPGHWMERSVRQLWWSTHGGDIIS
jgi:hypothetical protein